MRFPKVYFIIPCFFILLLLGFIFISGEKSHEKIIETPSEKYWFILHRKSNTEELLFGTPGNKEESKVVRTFKVKTGIPNERPTPLPKLVGREYWNIIKKEPSPDNPETSPYFITLDVPAPSMEPFGPAPYNECNGEQCNWILPGAFGLHGTGGDISKISDENPGSSGCIRHSDEDITFLYKLLEPEKYFIRYYIEDN